MSVTSVDKDPAARTMTIVAEFDAPVPRVWRLWADPARLARWWGPPDHPATVTEHDLSPGGRVAYHVTGPRGERRDGWWSVRSVEPPTALAFELGDPEIPPVAMRVRLEELAGDRTRMTIEASFGTDGDMRLMISIGFAEGMAAAAGQIDAVLREAPEGVY